MTRKYFFRLYLTNLVILVILSLCFIFNLNNFFKDCNCSNREPSLKSFHQEKNCEIINKNAKLFKVKINDVVYPRVLPLYNNKSINFKCLNSTYKNVKKILMWTKFNGLPFQNYGFGVRKPFEFMNCPVTNCELTNDRTKFNTSDLVLFHLRNKIDYFPNRTDPNQRFVHVIYEPPIGCHLCEKFEGVFNISATYTSDSDYTSIYWGDSGLFWGLNENYMENQDVYSTKTKFAASLISNCNDRSARMEYIKRLKKFISIDIYGACGNKCNFNQDCREYIASNYKFFFVFENSICRDYITEKFFEALKYNIIPVVTGFANYQNYAPKSAYIDVLDFKSPKQLAEYLNYLDRNKTAYNEYFKWKKYLKYDHENKVIGSFLCEMCIQLHLEDHNIIQKSNKELKNLKKQFGLHNNCKEAYFDSSGDFMIGNLIGINYVYLMSQE